MTPIKSDPAGPACDVIGDISASIKLPRLLTEKAAAEALGVHVDTLRAERKDGHIRYIKIRGQVRYTNALLVDYLQAQERIECPKNRPPEKDDPEKSADTGSPSTETVLCGAELGTIVTLDKHDVHRLTQSILSKRS